MNEKNLEKLRETMIGVFSSYLSTEHTPIENQSLELQSFSTTNVPSLESPSLTREDDKSINLNVTINQNNREPLSLSPFNIKTNQKNVNVNLKKNELLVPNILSSNLYVLMNSQKDKTNIIREKFTETKFKNKSSIIKTPMSFIINTPYNFITNAGNYSIEKIENKVNKVNIKEETKPTFENLQSRLPVPSIDDRDKEYFDFFQQIKTEDLNSYDNRTKNLFTEILNFMSQNQQTINTDTINQFNEEQLNPTSFEFLSKETYIPVELAKREKLNFKNLKNRLVSKQKAKLIKNKKENTKALIPAFSTGALVSSPTFALLGESRPEMVAPIQVNIEKYWNHPIGRIDTAAASIGRINEIQPNIDNSLSKSITSNVKLKENTNSSDALATKKENQEKASQNPPVDTNSRAAIADVSRPHTKMYDFRDLKINSTTESVSTFLNNLKALPGRRQVHM